MIRHLGGVDYGVAGCDKRATYTLRQGGVRRWALNTITPATRPASTPPQPQVQTVKVKQGGQTSVKVTQRGEKDVALSSAFVPEHSNLTVKLKAKPVAHPDVVLLGFERGIGKELMNACDVKMVANGELVSLPPANYAQPTEKHEVLAFELPVDLFAQIAGSVRIVAQVCADRVEFGEADLAVLRDFLIRFREEQVLSGMV